VKRDGWGDKLHDFIKRSAQNPTITLLLPKNLEVPNICRYNQRVAMLRAKFKKQGKDPRLVVPAVTVEPYMRVVKGSHPLNYSTWCMTSSGGPAGGQSNHSIEEVCVHREVGSMSAYSGAAPHVRSMWQGASHVGPSFHEGGNT
jgi:hypothetical protein